MRKQVGWSDHARFMDALTDEGFIVLGGQLGEGEKRFLLIFNTENEETVWSRLDDDPWTSMKMLQVSEVEPWEILLGGSK
jgi:uncharacterized protein YciI